MSKADRTRQLIIEKAAPIFNKKGIAGTSISDIMEATQLAKGGVYGNFQSKDEISLEAYNYLTNLLTNKIKQALEGKATAREKLFALLDYYNDRLSKNTTGGCPILNFGVEADDTNEVIRKRVSQSIANSENRFAQLVEQGIDSGEFKPEFDAKSFALKAFSMIEGSILVSRVQGSGEHMRLITGMLKAEIEANTI